MGWEDEQAGDELGGAFAAVDPTGATMLAELDLASLKPLALALGVWLNHYLNHPHTRLR